ncbi:MAG: hypothetical protein JO323_21465 [Acidobacteriia bacterium]|nr:hypothetical protein [Terriglobia bacterium]
MGTVPLIFWAFWQGRVHSHETLTTTVLFDREIVRILNSHCVMCHFQNGPSFPLETYDQTWVRARKIRAEVIARHMPPWSAFPGYGRFANDNSLTLRETQFVVSWVEGSGPRNAGRAFTNIADPSAPRPKEIRAEADFDRWHLGEPDLTRQLPANTIEAQSGDSIQRSTIDLGLSSGRFLRGFEYRPAERSAVRAAFFTIQETGQWVGSWTPWYGYTSLSKAAAWRLPAGSHLVAEIHYRGAKERVLERGTVGLFFAKESTADAVSDLVLEAKSAAPVATEKQKFRATTRLAGDIYALALRPEVFPGAESLEVSARKPDGTTKVMLFAKNLQPDWPTPYIFKTPILLSKGTELSVVAYYSKTESTAQSTGVRLTISSVPARGRL